MFYCENPSKNVTSSIEDVVDNTMSSREEEET